MHQKSFLPSLLFILLLFQTVFGKSETIRLNSEISAFKIEKGITNEFSVNINIPEINIDKIQTSAGQFTRLSAPGFYPSVEIGAPQIPVLNRLIEIPGGDNLEIEVEIVNAEVEEIDLPAIGYKEKIIPAQRSLSKSQKPEDVPFRMDAAKYEEDKFSNESIAQLKIRGYLRNKRIGLLQIQPVQYNPVSNKLKIYKNLELRIIYRNTVYDAKSEKYYSPAFEPVLKKIEITSSTKSTPELTQYPLKYMIIADSVFKQTLQPFIKWKIQKGFDVLAAFTQQPAVGYSANSIREYIRAHYEENNPAPSYILLVGDVDRIPAFTGKTATHPTDFYYGEMTNDSLPDILVGRFSVSDTTELKAIINKTLAMEKYEISDDSFFGRSVHIAGWDATYAFDYGYPHIRYSAENYFKPEFNFTKVDTFLTTGAGQYETEIFNAIASGVGFVNYTAHGNATSWSNPSFNILKIDTLTNSKMYPLVIGNCCLTNKFDYNESECFGEAWIRAKNKGSVGYIGATNETFWDEDLWWAVGFYSIDKSYGSNAPAYSETGMGALDAAFRFGYSSQASIILAGNLAVEEAGSGLTDYYWEVYQLMGDPSYMPYFGQPQENLVNIPATFSVGYSSYINCDSGSVVALSKNEDLLFSEMAAQSGQVWIPADIFTSPDSLNVVITAQNKKPVARQVPTIYSGSVTIIPDSVSIGDSADVEITIRDDALNPLGNVLVSINGWGVDSSLVNGRTDSAGKVNLSFVPPFGELLTISGVRPGDYIETFLDTIVVTGRQDFTDLQLSVETPLINLADTLSPGWPGLIKASTPDTGLIIFVKGCGLDSSLNYDSISITPTTTGNIQVAVASTGFNIYEQNVPVVYSTGYLDGWITDTSGLPVRDAEISVYNNADWNHPIAAVYSDSSGYFQFSQDFLSGYYQLTPRRFEYLNDTIPVLIQHGHTSTNITQGIKPTGLLFGRIIKTGTDSTLNANIQIFRPEYDEWILYRTFEDSMIKTELPYSKYVVNIIAENHLEFTDTIIVNFDTVRIDYPLIQARGRILVIDDEPGKRAKGKDSPEIYQLDTGDKTSVDEIADILEELEYLVDIQTIDATDYNSWTNYDLLISSSGGNHAPVADSAFRNSLQAYIQNDGRLLIEGGEIGFDCVRVLKDTAFCKNILHINEWVSDDAGGLHLSLRQHSFVNTPNILADSITIDYSVVFDNDACIPTEDADLIYFNMDTSARYGGIIAYDNEELETYGQILFFSFNFIKAGSPEQRRDLMENAVIYLTKPEPKNHTIEEHLYKPSDYCLFQNYPNPFNPTTTIAFELPENSHVSLVIYNMLGQKVKTLANENLSFGHYELQWRGTNDKGQLVSTGIYFYSIHAGDFFQTRKMLFIK